MNRTASTLALLILSSALCAADEPAHLVHRWEHDPDLGTIWVIPPTRPTPVLQPARLSSSFRELRLSAAQLAIRHARDPLLQGGQAGLPVLLEQLKSKSEDQAVRLSQAAAAIALSQPEQSEILWQLLRDDDATRPLIERALVTWQLPLALETWRARLDEPLAKQQDLLIAIEGIGAAGDATDRPALEALLRDDRFSSAVKVVVARALGRVATSGLESLAQDVLVARVDHRELLTAELLAHHSTDAARQILEGILQSDSLPAHAVAYAAIAENFPSLARELAVPMLTRSDNNLRRKACEVLNRFDDPESLRLLAGGISDPNSQIRQTVRDYMLKKAELPELRMVVDEAITAQLTGSSHHGIEQAILMAVALEEHDRAPQLVALLDHSRPETTMQAAWGLQELANTPQVAQSIFEFTQPITQRLAAGEEVSQLHIFRQSFLFEALGRNQFKPATEMLKIYIPKNGHKMGDVARASAIWALGKILQDSQDNALAKQLAQRMHDESVTDPEEILVRYNATLALGWIGAPSSLGELKQVPYTPPDPLGVACQWALQQFAK